MKPTILYLITQENWGGSQRYIFDLVSELYSHNRIIVAIGEKTEPHGLSERLLDFKKNHPSSNIEIIKIKNLIRKISPIHDIRALFEIRKLYTRCKPTIIHLNSTKAGILGSLARMGLTIPVVYTVHGWVFKESLSKFRTWFYIIAEKITSAFKDTFIVLSEEEKNDARTILKIPEKKLEIIPLGISKENTCFSKVDARKKLDIQDTTTIQFGTIANFYPTKGLDILLDALGIISVQKQTLPPYQVHIIGDGPDRTLLESKIKKNNLEQMVTLHGFIPEAEKLITAFDICIIPSRKEGLPYSLLTATKYGIPTIATKVGGIPSFAQKVSSVVLITPEQPKELATALENALTVYAPEKKQEASTIRLPLEFTLPEMSKKTELLYQALMNLTKEQ